MNASSLDRSNLGGRRPISFGEDHIAIPVPSRRGSIQPPDGQKGPGTLGRTSRKISERTTPHIGASVSSIAVNLGQSPVENSFYQQPSEDDYFICTVFNKIFPKFQDPYIEQAFHRYTSKNTVFNLRAVVLLFFAGIVTRYSTLISVGMSERESSTLWSFLTAGCLVPYPLMFLATYLVKQERFIQSTDSLAVVLVFLTATFHGPIRFMIYGSTTILQEERTRNWLLLSTVIVHGIVRTRFRYVAASFLVNFVIHMVYVGVMFGKSNYQLSAGVSALFGVAILYILWENEQFFRRQFVSRRAYQFLHRAIGRSHDNNSPKENVDFDTPLHKAQLILKAMIADPLMEKETHELITIISALLNAPNVLAPDIETQVKAKLLDLDIEQEKWVMREIMSKSRSVKSVQNIDSTNPRPFNSRAAELLHPIAQEADESDNSTELMVARMDYELKNWMFDVFKWGEETEGEILAIMSSHILTTLDVFDALKIPAKKFLSFGRAVQKRYRDLPYHNSLHAADVLHSATYLMFQENCSSSWSPIHILALVVASMIHDIDHPGYSNNFMIQTQTEKLSLLYNDRSVLENHHLHVAFEILKSESCDFTENFTAEQKRIYRSIVIDLVLATDLANHINIISQFKTIVASGSFNPKAVNEDRIMLLKIGLKCADVSNASKPFDYYRNWMDRILSEFFRQGDREKELGLPISPYCDRENTNVPSSQIGFINFICYPSFDALNGFCPLPTILENIKANLHVWTPKEKADQPPVEQGPAPNALITTLGRRLRGSGKIGSANFQTKEASAASHTDIAKMIKKSKGLSPHERPYSSGIQLPGITPLNQMKDKSDSTAST
eukprot:Partr_v1_DN28842_c4_g1_i2_m33960 putative Phosphodiesterase